MKIDDVIPVLDNNLMVSYAIYDDDVKVVNPTFTITNNNTSVIIQYNLENVTVLQDSQIVKIINQLELIGGYVTYTINLKLQYLNIFYSPNLN